MEAYEVSVGLARVYVYSFKYAERLAIPTLSYTLVSLAHPTLMAVYSLYPSILRVVT